ncbi:MAG: IS200/IS605 family transposase [Pyrinomonadaceae bacterium]
MANTYSHCYNHIVFSTKDRVDFIDAQIETRVWAYIGGMARKHGMTALQVGGVDDHIHTLVSSPPSVAPSKIAQVLKGDSSYGIHNEFQSLKKFAWQAGYAVFSVSRSHAPRVIDYIKNQRAHHTKQTFEDEYVELLKLHEIDYDERYLFG